MRLEIILILLGVTLLAGIGAIFFLSSSSSGDDGKQFAQEPFEVGTINLAFFEDDDATTCFDIVDNFPRTDEQIQALADYLAAQNLEIIALQEIENPNALDKLANYLPSSYATFTSGQRECQRVAYLYNKDRFSVSEITEIKDLDVSRGLRNGLGAMFKDNTTDQEFFAINVHLKCCSNGELMRQNQLRKLSDWLEDWREENPETPVMVLGDFNDRLHSSGNFDLISESLELELLTDELPDMLCEPQGRQFTEAIVHVVASGDLLNRFSGTVLMENFFSDESLTERQSFTDHCLIWAKFN